MTFYKNDLTDTLLITLNSLDYLFQLAVEMVRLGMDPAGPITAAE